MRAALEREIRTIEAMAVGLPLLLSDIPVMREVSQGNALFFDPNDPHSFVEMFERIRSGDVNLAELSRKDPKLVQARHHKSGYVERLNSIYARWPRLRERPRSRSESGCAPSPDLFKNPERSFMTDDLLDVSTHFRFGENWAQYSELVDGQRIATATDSVRNLIGDLSGKTFLDIGSGSGLFSVAALRLGAKKVVAIDIDEDSVVTTRKLLSRRLRAG